MATSRGPLHIFLKKSSWGQKWPRPQGSKFFTLKYIGKLSKISSENTRSRALIFGIWQHQVVLYILSWRNPPEVKNGPTPRGQKILHWNIHGNFFKSSSPKPQAHSTQHPFICISGIVQEFTLNGFDNELCAFIYHCNINARFFCPIPEVTIFTSKYIWKPLKMADDLQF